jgi:hypothetical protein
MLGLSELKRRKSAAPLLRGFIRKAAFSKVLIP